MELSVQDSNKNTPCTFTPHLFEQNQS